MIVSNTLQCIFVAIPKTATHAIRFALRRYLDEKQDWEQVGLFVQKKMPFMELAKIDTGHIKAMEAKPVLGEALWSRYFKFAVVRNPYDRFVSFCAFIHREDQAFEKNARMCMKNIIAAPDIQQRILFRPQHEFVCDHNGEIMLDFLARHEQLQGDYTQICARLGIRATTLPRVNRSIHGPYIDYYDKELRMAVFNHYQRDFELFGYDPAIK
ncbi:MAG: sulfotransferase family 2 domain-containing protein [Candidatus Competibacteraceae bacterium]|nr:sulfotransferase family 2 domain-containing protein [Candidatus Competibacteraceae bacterium]